jgi:ectoine hydroxylase-related dioxygenase (phytanoyl-CoA dioxygenase family)
MDALLALATALVVVLTAVVLARRTRRPVRTPRSEPPTPAPDVRLDAAVSALDADAATDAIAACVRAHGVCCVENFFGEAQVREWAAEVARLREAGCATHVRNRNLGRSEHNFEPLMHPFDRDRGGVLADARLVRVLKRLLGAKVRVETAGSVLAEPGAAVQRWHQDVPHLFATGPHLPTHFVAVFVPLCNITDANGPTEFRAGSHIKANIVERPRELALACPLGSLIIFDGRVFHRGGANGSSEPREVLFLNVCRHWFRDMSNKIENRLERIL